MKGDGNIRMLYIAMLGAIAFHLASAASACAQPDRTQTIIATGTNGIIRSDDGGRTWQVTSGDDAERLRDNDAERVVTLLGISAGDRAMHVRYTLARSSAVTLELVDMSGAIVAGEDLGGMPAGEHVAELPIGRTTGGCFIVRVRCGGQVSGAKILIAQ